MLIAHLPAGYLLTRFLPPANKRLSLWITGLFFSIVPDFDLIWFYLVSDRKVPHNASFFHWPVFWTLIFLCAFLVSVAAKKRSWGPYIIIGYAGVMLHLLLDSFAATIYWLAPFSNMAFNIIEVPAQYDWWVMNFVFHWFFIVELIIVATAIFLLVRSYRKKTKTRL